MALKIFGRKKELAKANMLELTPYKFYGQEIDQDGNMIVLIPKFTNKYMVKFLLPKMKSKYFKLKLDKLGSGVWGMINGENKIKFIAEELIKMYGDEIQPVYERLPKFVSMLYQNKLISFKEVDK